MSHLKRLKLDWPIAFVFGMEFQKRLFFLPFDFKPLSFVVCKYWSTIEEANVRYLYDLWSKSDIWDRTNDNKYCALLSMVQKSRRKMETIKSRENNWTFSWIVIFNGIELRSENFSSWFCCCCCCHRRLALPFSHFIILLLFLLKTKNMMY